MRNGLNCCRDFKKFTKKEWKALKLIALSTPTSGQIRWHDGGTWEWKSSGKYVVAQKAEKRIGK